jgi:hypothetical protein
MDGMRLMSDAERLLKVSVRLFDCLCEFEDDPTACAEHEMAWDDAVIAYKQSLKAKAEQER